MFFCIKPPRLEPTDPEPTGRWFNTDHIVEVREIRRRLPNDEPLALRIFMMGGDRVDVDVQNAGRGMAERILGWLNDQVSLPEAPDPKGIASPLREDVDKKKKAVA